MEPLREEARLPALALIVRGLQPARQQYRRTTVMLLAGEWTCMAASVRTASVQVSKAERLCAALAPAPTPAPHGAARDERHSRWSNGGHRCRLCGLLFCGRCSGGRVPLLGWGELAPTPTGLGARAIHSFRDLFRGPGPGAGGPW